MMRFAAILALSAFAAAQDSTGASNSTAPANGTSANSTALPPVAIPTIDPTKAKTVATVLPDLIGDNLSAKSSSVHTLVMQPGVGGLFNFKQTIAPSAKATDSVVQSWLILDAVGGAGQDFYVIDSDT